MLDRMRVVGRHEAPAARLAEALAQPAHVGGVRSDAAAQDKLNSSAVGGCAVENGPARAPALAHRCASQEHQDKARLHIEAARRLRQSCTTQVALEQNSPMLSAPIGAGAGHHRRRHLRRTMNTMSGSGGAFRPRTQSSMGRGSGRCVSMAAQAACCAKSGVSAAIPCLNHGS